MLIKVNEVSSANDKALIFNTDHIIFIEPYRLGGCIVYLTGGRTAYLDHTVEQIAEAMSAQLIVLEMKGRN